MTRFVANSTFVRDRIRRYYDRDAEVIHPFVDDAFLRRAAGSTIATTITSIVSALVPYKRIDLAIAAAVAGKRLVVIGGGPLLEELRAPRRPQRRVPRAPYRREVIIERMARARSLILPGVEDFGITPLEAMAARHAGRGAAAKGACATRWSTGRPEFSSTSRR